MRLDKFLEHHYKGNVTIVTAKRETVYIGSAMEAFSKLNSFELKCNIFSMNYVIHKKIWCDQLVRFESLEVHLYDSK